MTNIISLNDFVNFIFGLGLFLNAALFIPQAIRIFATKDVSGNSIITFLGFNIMQFFTAWHGYLVRDYLLMLGFCLSFITCGAVTLQLILYRKKANECCCKEWGNDVTK